jgi:serine O-acetyltransferase
MIFIDDLKAKANLFYSAQDTKSILKALMTDGAGAVFLYRLMRFFMRFKLYPFAYLVQYLNKLINNCVIGLKADFGKGLMLCHPIGVVINSAVNGGENIVMESGVVLGDNRGKSPQLASNIYIGSGAKIIGDVKIGSNVKVGANAVVTKDVPTGHVAVGIPAICRPFRQ